MENRCIVYEISVCLCMALQNLRCNIMQIVFGTFLKQIKEKCLLFLIFSSYRVCGDH